MRLFPLVSSLIAAVLLTACASTPDARIAGNRAMFDQFPPAVQQQIRAGQVAVGFTTEMARLAWGEPARIFTRKSEQGDTEVWSYGETGSRVFFGLGFGTFGRHSSTHVGVGASTGGRDPVEVRRVEFRDGQVIAVESRAR
jgi:hypothetical protein